MKRLMTASMTVLFLTVPLMALATEEFIAEPYVDMIVDGSDRSAVEQEVDTYNSRADGDRSASASQGSSAHVDNSIELDDQSVVTQDVLGGTVSHNVINYNDTHVYNDNRFDDNAFRDVDGINQVAQVSGDQNIVNQNMSLIPEVPVTHIFGSSP